MKQFLDHRDVNAVQDPRPVGLPVAQKVIYDLGAELEGGVVECRWNVLDRVGVRESNGANA